MTKYHRCPKKSFTWRKINYSSFLIFNPKIPTIFLNSNMPFFNRNRIFLKYKIPYFIQNGKILYYFCIIDRKNFLRFLDKRLYKRKNQLLGYNCPCCFGYSMICSQYLFCQKRASSSKNSLTGLLSTGSMMQVANISGSFLNFFCLCLFCFGCLGFGVFIPSHCDEINPRYNSGILHSLNSFLLYCSLKYFF